MTIEMRAAVVRAFNQLTVETVTLDPPKPYEVLVRMQAAGVCHSDVHTLHGQMRATPPLVLGHEGAGIVEAVGAQVQSVKQGDHVIVNWMPNCTRCYQCQRGKPNLCEHLARTTFQALLPDGTTRLHTQEGMALKHHLSAATMAEYAVLDEASVLPIPDDVPFPVAAVIGCGVITGVGAAINTAQAKAGQSAAVIGCGGVGLSAIMGCALAGCYPIVAVDTVAAKLDFALSLGATHTILADANSDFVAELKQMMHGGPDIVIDSVGATSTIPQALEAAAPGGAAVIVGLHGVKQPAAINPAALVYQNKRLLGSYFGSANAVVDLPMLVGLYRAGRLPVDRLISAHYELGDVHRAFADLEAGKVARSVLTMERA